MSFRRIAAVLRELTAARDVYREIADALKVFQTDLNFDPAWLKKEYRKLSRKYHPDRSGGDIEQMKKINSAWDALTADKNQAIIKELKRRGKITPSAIIRFGRGRETASSNIHPDIFELKRMYSVIMDLRNMSPEQKLNLVMQGAKDLDELLNFGPVLENFLRKLSDAYNPSDSELKEARRLVKESKRLFRKSRLTYGTSREKRRQRAKIHLTDPNFLFFVVYLAIIFMPIALHMIRQISLKAWKAVKKIKKKLQRKWKARKRTVKQKAKDIKKEIDKLPEEEKMAALKVGRRLASRLRR